MRDLQLWQEYYLRWDYDSFATVMLIFLLLIEQASVEARINELTKRCQQVMSIFILASDEQLEAKCEELERTFTIA